MIGFAVIFIAVLISELKLDPVKLFRKKSKEFSDITTEKTDLIDGKNN